MDFPCDLGFLTTWQPQVSASSYFLHGGSGLQEQMSSSEQKESCMVFTDLASLLPFSVE